MVIQIGLTPEEEARLRQQADQRGTAPEELAATYVRAHLPFSGTSSEGTLPPVVDQNGVFHPERLKAVLDRCSRLSSGLPYLSPESLTREAIYQDHD